MNHPIYTQVKAFGLQVETLASDGGWLMYPLTLLAFLIYFEGLRLWLKILIHPMYRKSKGSLTQSNIHWLSNCLTVTSESPVAQQKNIEHLRSHIMQHFQRRSKMIERFVKCGPLLGLLGTVIGMLETFRGMMDLGLDRSESMAIGISQALITTQYGLIVAIPGMILLSCIRHSLKCLDRNLLSLKTDISLSAKSTKTSDSILSLSHVLHLNRPKRQAMYENAESLTEAMSS